MDPDFLFFFLIFPDKDNFPNKKMYIKYLFYLSPEELKRYWLTSDSLFKNKLVFQTVKDHYTSRQSEKK